MTLLLASEIDPHPDIPVKGSCQHMASVNQETGPTTEQQQQGVSDFQWVLEVAVFFNCKTSVVLPF
jgi:hypothetical protein